MSVLDWRLDEAAYAILDIETTGLRCGVDRIVEICIVRLDPGEPAGISLDTLVDPCQPMAGSHIHGIEASEVVDAPRIIDLAGEILRSLCGRILVGHNVSFDRRWLAAELAPLGLRFEVPVLDTMRLRPLLGDGPRATLTQSCTAYGIVRSAPHRAAADAYDTARLLHVQLNRARVLGLRTFREISRLGASTFAASLALSPLAEGDARVHPVNTERRTRSARPKPTPLRDYAEALMLALADGILEPHEAAYLKKLRADGALEEDDVFALHGQAFAAGLLTFVADASLTSAERSWLTNLARSLRSLGWCPGDPEN